MFILVFVIFNLDSENFSSLRMVLVQGAPILSFVIFREYKYFFIGQYILPGFRFSGSPFCYFYSMKDFLVLGRCTAMGYKGINDCILEGKIWFGCTETGKMIGGDVHCYWFSNLVSDKKVEFIPLTRKYKEGDYRKMDFYDAINIDSIYDIPDDYPGVMAVPVTFLNKWCKDQFEVLDARDYTDDVRLKKMDTKIINTGSYVDGVSKFTRILIKKK